MVRQRSSPLWQYFDKLSSSHARCHSCSSTVSHKTTISNLRKHLKLKHPEIIEALKSFNSSDEDPREGLKEFITLEGTESFQEDDDNEEAQPKDPADTEWVPPKKFMRKTAPHVLQKKVKPEVFTANNIEYLIYPPHEQTSRPNRCSAPPVMKSGSADAKADEDEFSIFARFLAQRVRTLKDPYWQSCAINEINSALHKVEMRRYEPPKVFIGSDLAVQTEGELMQPQIKSYSSMSPGVNQGQNQLRANVVEEIVTTHEVVEQFE